MNEDFKDLDLNQLDKIDRRILEILQENGSISNLDLSKEIGLAASSCLLRVKSLKEKGYIKKIIAKVDAHKLGYEVEAFLRIQLKSLTRDAIDNFLDLISQIPQVTECYMTTGEGTFLAKIIAKNLQDYYDIILDKITSINAVNNVETSIVIKTEKLTNCIPIN